MSSSSGSANACARPVSTPLGVSRKRKVRDGFDAPHPPPITTKLEPGSSPPVQLAASGGSGNGNRLLAGYLAHEFLTMGTMFGQRWDPTRPGRPRDLSDPAPAPAPAPSKAYDDVASLLKTEGAHIPGVVNPTQLARWLQM